MNLFGNFGLVDDVCAGILSPHPCYYSFASQILPTLKAYPNLKYSSKVISVKNNIKNIKQRQNQISLHLINNIKNRNNIIVYLHGLGSYCLQGKFSIPHLGNNFSLCLYDSRGHGKNKANTVTYGLLQAQQLLQIIKQLSQPCSSIILYGRSMGAVACLRALAKYSNHSALATVKYIIADSPFSSFDQIAKQQISRMVHLPEFIAEKAVEIITKKIKEKQGIDLRQINLTNFICHKPCTFFYSSKDEIVEEKHIKTIYKCMKGRKEIIDVLLKHNDQRPFQLISKTFARILKTISQKQKDQSKKKRGISVSQSFIQQGSTKTIRFSHVNSIQTDKYLLRSFVSCVAAKENRVSFNQQNTIVDYPRQSVKLKRIKKQQNKRKKLENFALTKMLLRYSVVQ